MYEYYIYEYIPISITNLIRFNYSLKINNFMDNYLYFSN